ncbi:hypothetical protein DRE_03281 [Drechslerella stenobrocha 248]|uniref:G domain-containing protein n=1 Tax=Drechslerella stenobrocha 248 TaxID=1043628 RepID=W7HU13_9PEZI|nr:hypothetical protein DRE_03281 [Drechslerella stenobrocha 248]
MAATHRTPPSSTEPAISPQHICRARRPDGTPGVLRWYSNSTELPEEGATAATENAVDEDVDAISDILSQAEDILNVAAPHDQPLASPDAQEAASPAGIEANNIIPKEVASEPVNEADGEIPDLIAHAEEILGGVTSYTNLREPPVDDSRTVYTSDSPDELSYEDPISPPEGPIVNRISLPVGLQPRQIPSVKPKFCPGCGAESHSDSNRKHEAGYYGPEDRMPAPKDQTREVLDAVYRSALVNMSPEVKELMREANMAEAPPAESVGEGAADPPPEADSEVLEVSKAEKWLSSLDVGDSRLKELNLDMPLRPQVCCSRCRNLAHHEKLLSEVPDANFGSVARAISKSPFKRIHIYHVVDAADFPLSILGNAKKAILRALKGYKGGAAKDVTLSYVITRADLLMPTEEKATSLMTYIRRVLSTYFETDDVGLKGLRLVSAKRTWTTEKLKDEVRARKGGIYLLGKTNVGKSRLYEAIFPKRNIKAKDKAIRRVAFGREDLTDLAATKEEGEEDDYYVQNGEKVRYPDMPLASKLPGTTAGPITIDFAAGRGQLVDLPGFQREGIMAYIKPKLHTSAVLVDRIIPRKFVVMPGQTFMLGGLVLVEWAKPPDQDARPVTLEAAAFTNLPGHVFATEKKDKYFEISTGVVRARPFVWAGPTIGNAMKPAGVFKLTQDITAQRCKNQVKAYGPQWLKNISFRIYATDILIEGCGWVEVSANVGRNHPIPEIKVVSPMGKGVAQRECMGAFHDNLRPTAKVSPGSRPRKSMKGAKRVGQAEKRELSRLAEATGKPNIYWTESTAPWH